MLDVVSFILFNTWAIRFLQSLACKLLTAFGIRRFNAELLFCSLICALQHTEFQYFKVTLKI